ncbi:GNAT family N-acetyltransferase [Sulfidibacter corallicola]|uniref:GNAT family N-acetyltransferase n=1 Tax=Sulfidibacter corallicola TaxID=2818388 RepID=A0A8A4TXU6_SULCO|nr:GNAT family N-acetyltransferase [Sulfidibacter corallicola]QTD53792.1 GNAT family N-acetyltransferase [Sulfidibacter corallicola]
MVIVSAPKDASSPTKPLLSPEPHIRAAEQADADAIVRLVAGFARVGEMLPVTHASIRSAIPRFTVVETAGTVIGCGALFDWGDGSAEIRSLAVNHRYAGLGIGRMLVDHLTRRAEATEAETLFAMTLKPGFFERLGFERVARSRMPAKIDGDCTGCAFREGCREVAMWRALTVTS